MVKFATSPGMLSTLPSRVSAQAVSTAPDRATHAQTSSSITIHSHSLSRHTPQVSVSRNSSYGGLRRRESVSPHLSLPPRSAPNNHDLSPPQSPPTTTNSDPRRLSALCALDPSFPCHLQHRLLLICRQCGR